ncbi:uncharacterized protein DS421_16g557210 [Arachis hypogaea]|nr:uncharacterized protein DS421_16g557210 [Arachis hypogaea]
MDGDDEDLDGDASFSLCSLSLGSGLPRDDTTAATVVVTPTGATSLPSSSLPSPVLPLFSFPFLFFCSAVGRGKGG